MTSLPILIAGAGIGGLTTAIAFARRGIPLIVCEKRTRFHEVGAGIQVSPNAGRVLESLDLGLALRRIAVRPDRLEIRHWNGNGVLTMPFSAGPADQTPFRTVKRADIHQILLDAARTMPNIRWLIGRGLAEVKDEGDHLDVTLASETGQTETLQVMGLVGADGAWSRSRVLAGDARPPRFTGWEAWRTLVSVAGLPASLRAAKVTLQLGRARHAVYYPVASGQEINLVIIRGARHGQDGWSRPGQAQELSATLSHACGDLRRLVADAPAWHVWSLHDRPPTAMANGRIALLGDAAHPVLPFLAQGAGLAIEDAAVLADALSHRLAEGGAAALPAAFAAYAAARAQRAARVQETSRNNGSAYHLAKPWSYARDMVLRRLGPDGLRQRHAWVYDWMPPAG